MDNNDKRIEQILNQITSAASAAASGVSDAMQNAGLKVGEKYDVMKVSIELSRIQDEQKKLFTDIGRTLYLIKSSSTTNLDSAQSQLKDAQKTVDRLLLIADQKQQEIDYLAERLAKLNGSKICNVCGKIMPGKDIFCSSCGSKLDFND